MVIVPICSSFQKTLLWSGLGFWDRFHFVCNFLFFFPDFNSASLTGSIFRPKGLTTIVTMTVIVAVVVISIVFVTVVVISIVLATAVVFSTYPFIFIKR